MARRLCKYEFWKNNFYWRWIKGAFVKPFIVADVFSVVLGLGFLITQRIRPSLENNLTTIEWAVPLGVFGASLVAGFILAPYYMQKRAKSSADDAECVLSGEIHRLSLEKDALAVKLKPQLTIISVSKTGNPGTGYYRGLKIKNEGISKAVGCRGQIEETYPVGAGEEARNFQWSMASSMGAVAIGDIIAGQSAVLDIAYLDPVERDTEGGGTIIVGTPPAQVSDYTPRLVYSGGHDFRSKQSLPINTEVLVLLNVGSDGYAPLYAVCRLKTYDDPDRFDLEVIKTMVDRPDLTNYLSSISHTEGHQPE